MRSLRPTEVQASSIFTIPYFYYEADVTLFDFGVTGTKYDFVSSRLSATALLAYTAIELKTPEWQIAIRAEGRGVSDDYPLPVCSPIL